MTKANVFWAVLIIFAVYLMYTMPAEAAKLVHAAWHGTVQIMHGAAGFVSRL